jgi:hypothetical protein
VLDKALNFSRKRICEKIIASVNDILSNTPSGEEFWKDFLDARIALVAHWTKELGRMVSEDARPALGPSAKQKMADLGVAEGEPGSS